jgi:hypothetical protein
MNDHQRKMARKGGQACGYAIGGLVKGAYDDDDAADDIIKEEDDAEHDAKMDARPTDVEKFNEWAKEVGPEPIHRYIAAQKATDKVRRSNLRANETRPQRARREDDEAEDAVQQRLEDQRQDRRDYVLGRKAKI